MLKNNYGHIVAVSSCAGFTGLRNLVPYCGSKYAVRGLMEALENEIVMGMKRSIHFTVVYPYIVDTGLCKSVHARFEQSKEMLNPKYVADKIIEAQRRNLNEVSVPNIYMFTHNICR